MTNNTANEVSDETKTALWVSERRQDSVGTEAVCVKSVSKRKETKCTEYQSIDTAKK